MISASSPLVNNEITAEQAFERASDPFHAFMLKNVREKDLKLFVDMSREAAPVPTPKTCRCACWYRHS